MHAPKRHHAKSIIISIGIILLIGAGVAGALAYFQPFKTQPTKQPSTTTSPSSQPAQVSETALSCTEKLSDDALIGQKLMIAYYADSLNAQQPLMATYQLGGAILMNEMTDSAIASLSTGMTITPTIAVDQEGGTVQRFTGNGVMPGAETVASTLSTTKAFDLYSSDATYLKSLGITTDFAPVVDVISASPNPLPGRMYSSSPSTVITYAGQNIMAQQKAGIDPVIKHFPGLGSASGNTDNGSATTADLSVLKTRDLLPYQGLASLHPDAMVSNAIVPGLTNGQPAIWSPEAVSLLRSYGYENAVIYSDSLTAKAIPGTLADAAVKAWQAGIDVALIVQTDPETPQLSGYLNDIIAETKADLADGTIDKTAFSQSVARILARKSIDPCQLPPNKS